MKKLIVGIDPGVTCGLAALTLNGAPVFIGSRRGWMLANLLKMLTTIGEPIIISSDVSPAPELVEKLSANLNATLFTPLISLGTIEKQNLARSYAESYDVKLRNTHEIDALAAALKAYNHFKNKFEQIEIRIKNLGCKVSPEDVKALVIKGYAINKAIDHLLSRSGEVALPPIPVRKIHREERLKELVEESKHRLTLEKEETKRLRSENRELRKRIKSLEKEIFSFQRKIKEIESEQTVQIKREREYQRLLDEIESLRRKLLKFTAEIEKYKQRFDEAERLRELESKGERILLKPIESFTADGLEKAFKLYEIKPGDYVLLLDASGGGATTARTLSKKGVKAVIHQTPMAHQAQDEFAKYDIPAIPAGDVKIEWIEGFPYINSSSLRDALKRLKEREINELASTVEGIIEQHRRELKRIQ